MKILNFGSLNIDNVYSVSHFVRAGETLASTSLNHYPGGKGLNQSVAFAKAGAKVFHAGLIGTDGKMLSDLLENSGVNVSFVRTLQNEVTGHAVIQVSADGENCILLHGGANQMVDDAFVNEVLSHFDKGDAIILQNEINNLDYIIKSAKKRGLVTVLNPSPFNEVITALDLSLIDYLIINETEGKELSGKTESEAIISTLQARYPALKIVLTLGKNGAIYVSGDERCFQPIIEAPVVDTTAAGDTFTGFFFTTLFEGAAPEKALLLATAASSIAVSRAGAAVSIPTRAEVEAKICE